MVHMSEIQQLSKEIAVPFDPISKVLELFTEWKAMHPWITAILKLNL